MHRINRANEKRNRLDESKETMYIEHKQNLYDQDLYVLLNLSHHYFILLYSSLTIVIIIIFIIIIIIIIIIMIIIIIIVIIIYTACFELTARTLQHITAAIFIIKIARLLMIKKKSLYKKKLEYLNH
jgi:hypothetical protein